MNMGFHGAAQIARTSMLLLVGQVSELLAPP